MEAIVAILAFMTGFAILGGVAITFGVDSRDPFRDDYHHHHH